MTKLCPLAIPYIFSSRDYFQVFKAVIMPFAVLVVDVIFRGAFADKSLCNKTVNKFAAANRPATKTHFNSVIPLFIKSWVKDFAALIPAKPVNPFYTSDKSGVGNLIPTLASDYIAPFFFHLIPSIKTSLAVAFSTTKELARDVLKTSIGLFRLNNKLFRGKEYFTTGGISCLLA